MEDTSDIITRYNTFTEKVIEMGLLNDIESKPVLNVIEISRLRDFLLA